MMRILRHRLTRQLRTDDTGFSILEVVLLTPLVVAVLLLVGLGARLWDARITVNAVAQEAARAASVSRSEPAARTAAERVATTALGANGVRCTGGPTVAITKNANLTPGENVAVDISCRVDVRFFRMGIGNFTDVAATAESLVETYKGTP